MPFNYSTARNRIKFSVLVELNYYRLFHELCIQHRMVLGWQNRTYLSIDCTGEIRFPMFEAAPRSDLWSRRRSLFDTGGHSVFSTLWTSQLVESWLVLSSRNSGACSCSTAVTRKTKYIYFFFGGGGVCTDWMFKPRVVSSFKTSVIHWPNGVVHDENAKVTWPGSRSLMNMPVFASGKGISIFENDSEIRSLKCTGPKHIYH